MDQFDAIRDRMEAYDEARETIIKRSREILKGSKQAISSLQRGDQKKAESLLQEAERVMKELLPETKNHPLLREQGAFSAAMEEYVEAKSFLHFIMNGDLLGFDALPDATDEEYLKGLSDLTGELNRHVVRQATKGDRETVERAHLLVDEIYDQLSKFDFRNSDLRKKYDGIKYNLQKIERVLYDLSLQARTARQTANEEH